MNKTNTKINYSLPSGFDIELLPGERRLELLLLSKISRVFELYGFTPLETPPVERMEVLTAKGNHGDNIIYSLNPNLPLRDAGDSTQKEESRGLKFDQTVPLAAYIARHESQLQFPFARYQMDFVFRGERPKKGRHRIFRQIDIDIVAKDTLSVFYDAQMPAIIARIFTMLDIGAFKIKISNRKLLLGYLEHLDVSQDISRAAIRSIDELEKIGKEKVLLILTENGLSEHQAQSLISFVLCAGSYEMVQNFLLSQNVSESNKLYYQGLSELTQVNKFLHAQNVSQDTYIYDLSIARGLGYYTGIVYETTLTGHEGIGSICSGGRYDELLSLYLDRPFPGVGISIGWTRLFNTLLDLKKLQVLPATPADIGFAYFSDEGFIYCLSLAQKLRSAGVNIYLPHDTRALGKQLKTLDKMGIKKVLIIGDEELASKKIVCKDLTTGTQEVYDEDSLIEQLKQ
jgi:histidyl-tRNA synthetase